MLRFKQFLAFPMYGAAAWLVWVLAQEAGPNGVAIILAAFIALALAAWLWGVTRDYRARGRSIGALAALLILLAGLYGVSLLRDAAAAPAAAGDQARRALHAPPSSRRLRAANRPVFVDATAAWCITCLVNEDAVLSRDSVKERLRRQECRLSGGRLDQPESGNHRAAEGQWPLRRAALSLLCARRGQRQ